MWQNPPDDLYLLSSDQIHIWLLNIDNFTTNIQHFQQLLSEDEVRKSQKYKGENLQHNFVINRGFLRKILSKYVAIAPQEIIFNYNSKGKPFLTQNNQIHFNLSHKNEYTIYAISLQELGIDLEHTSNSVESEQIAKRFFTKDESEKISQLKPEKKQEYFYQLWTAKEAYLKAIGEGLSGGLDSINFLEKKSNNQWEMTIDKLSMTEIKKWQIFTFDVIPDYIASLGIKMENKLRIKYYLINNL